MSDTGVSHQAAPLISRHMKDLLRRPVSAVRICLDDPNTEGDVRQRKHSKGLAARAVAAKAIMKAIEGSGTHLEQILDRTEGKVGGNEQGGSTINFNFVVQGDQGARQVGELVTGALQSAGINRGMCQDVDAVPGSAQADQLAGINPPGRSIPAINPQLALPAPDPAHDEDK